MGEAKYAQIVPIIKERVDKNGKRWLQDHEEKYDKKIEEYAKTSESPNRYKILEYLEDMAVGDSSKKAERREVSKSRRLRILQIMTSFDGWMDYKKFEEITTYDMKAFVRRLKDDVIISPYNNTIYADTTKATIKKVIRKFWKWLKGKNIVYPAEVDWMDTREPTVTKDCYKEEEMKLLLENIHAKQMKVLVKLLFDGGFRISELANVRIKDIIHPTPEQRWFTINVRAEIAKRYKPRQVALFYVNQDLKSYLENHHPEPNNPKAFLFNYSYQYIRNFLHKKGKKVLGKSITPHGIRRTSATFWAPRIKSYQAYCYRFGWSLSSRVPDIYFNRMKMNNIDMMHQITAFERDRVRNEIEDQIITNHELIETNQALNLRLNKYEKELHQRKRYDSVIQKLLSEPLIEQKADAMLKQNLDSETKMIEGDMQ